MGELQGGQKVRVLLAQALFGHPQALLLDEPTNNLDLDSIHWLQGFLNNYDGVLIAISHDRHFLNSICTHIADIDYETIITYTGSYDDMVVAKTQVRSQIESQNAQREKKIAQLNEFIARFAAGTRSSQVQSRRKEVERLQVTELARSNIQRPFIKFEQKRPSGKHILEIEHLGKSYDDKRSFATSPPASSAARRIALMGRNGAGKTTLLNALLANSPTTPEAELRKTSGYDGAFLDRWQSYLGARSFHRLLRAGSPRLIADRHDSLRVAASVGSGRRHTKKCADCSARCCFAREDGNKKTERSLRRRSCAPALLQAHAAEAQRAGARRAHQPPRPRIDQRPEHRAAAYRARCLLVTHDHDLIDEVATRIWHFESDHKITDFKGAYEEYQSAVAAV